MKINERVKDHLERIRWCFAFALLITAFVFMFTGSPKPTEQASKKLLIADSEQSFILTKLEHFFNDDPMGFTLDDASTFFLEGNVLSVSGSGSVFCVYFELPKGTLKRLKDKDLQYIAHVLSTRVVSLSESIAEQQLSEGAKNPFGVSLSAINVNAKNDLMVIEFVTSRELKSQ